MKTRNGFVSNSSSSSFVVFGKETNIHDINEKDVNSIWIRGTYVGEGYDIFQLNEEIYLWLLDNLGVANNLEFIKTIHTIYSEDYPELDVDIPKGCQIFPFEKSYHSTDCFSTFVQRYGKE